jgi:hypothetical protein
MHEHSSTQFSQECRVTTEGTRNPEVITPHIGLEDTNNVPAIINANSNELPDNMPCTQLLDLLTTVMQAIKSECAKLTSAVQNLSSEIKTNNEQLFKNLTVKFEAAQNKIREDFEMKLNSDILIVSERMNDVSLKCTQDVLGYFSKVQGLNENRDSFRAPRRDCTSTDTNRRPQIGSR